MTKYNLSRLESTILYILHVAKSNGINNLSRFELMKLVYLIEVNAQKFIGEPFTQATFVRETNGPISYDIYKANEKLDKKGLLKISAQDNQEYGYPRYCHALIGKVPDLGLSDSELIFLNSVLDEYLGLSIKKLKQLAYITEPMVAIKESEEKSGVLQKGKRLTLEDVPLDEDILSAMLS